MSNRPVKQIIQGMLASDGAGVKLRRSIGQSGSARLDPFLMLDEFNTDRADDYIAGFPPHPHRGFETVTYMLEGRMLHEDHLGHRGLLQSGDVQWMTAARGIIHSEMPQQEEGRMHGFQLWINLPANEKMKAASYRDIPSRAIPQQAFEGGQVKVIAGTYIASQAAIPGPIQGLATQPLYFDVRLEPGGEFRHAIPSGHNAFVYVYEGDASFPGISSQGFTSVKQGDAGILGDGDQVHVQAQDSPVAFLLLAGKPLKEPIVQYGPFVMNTAEEIEQALRDYQQGHLTG